MGSIATELVEFQAPTSCLRLFDAEQPGWIRNNNEVSSSDELPPPFRPTYYASKQTKFHSFKLRRAASAFLTLSRIRSLRRVCTSFKLRRAASAFLTLENFRNPSESLSVSSSDELPPPFR